MREVGNLNFIDDDLSTPFGILKKSNDGKYYSNDLSKRITAIVNKTNIEIYLPSGTRILYGNQSEDVYSISGEKGVLRWFPKACYHESRFANTIQI